MRSNQRDSTEMTKAHAGDREPAFSIVAGGIGPGPEARAGTVAWEEVHGLVPVIDGPDERLDIRARERRARLEDADVRVFAEVVEGHAGEYSRSVSRPVSLSGRPFPNG